MSFRFRVFQDDSRHPGSRLHAISKNAMKTRIPMAVGAGSASTSWAKPSIRRVQGLGGGEIFRRAGQESAPKI
jgi:hypothetical protein